MKVVTGFFPLAAFVVSSNAFLLTPIADTARSYSRVSLFAEQAPTEVETKHFTIPLDHLGLDDIPKVGGKSASLGEMIQQLTPLGVDVPGGFAVSSDAYDAVLDQAGLRERLQDLMKDLDVSNLNDLADRGRKARQMILDAGLPKGVRKAIRDSYKELCKTNGGRGDLSVAVRSSATAEDLPTASFAGQQATFLNVVGARGVENAVLDCLASVFTDRAITYRVHNDFDHMVIKGAVAVQLMVRSDIASSGVAFTLDPDTGFRDVVVITGSYGLGESVVGGVVDPDEVQVFKPMIDEQDPIISRRIGGKQTSCVYTKGVSHKGTKTVAVSKADQKKPSFTDDEAKQLAKWCVQIEKHYSTIHGHDTPMDIEWAKDGVTGRLFIVQARPETVRARQGKGTLRQTIVTGKGDVIVEGTAIGSDAASGKVRVIENVADIATLQEGEVLVADITDPDWVPAMRKASALVTNRGGRTAHAAIVSRELGLPCIVGAKDATHLLKTGEVYTIDCTNGNSGRVHAGEARIVHEEVALDDLPKTRTKIQLILGDPDSALAHSSLPVSGVGLVRQEFVVASHIGIHPNAVIFPDRVDKDSKRLIKERARNDKSPKAFFVRKLAEGVGSIAAAFYPRPIIVRLGDFKSNEYRLLIGGMNFEPVEENPMIGLRGASRYLHPEFRDAFLLECEALSHVRNEMGLKNVQLMVPFCRTTDEAAQVLDLMGQNGLEQGKDGLNIWMMCEIPSNVFDIDEFAKRFDGFSIGSNDLTQLVLGIDRDSGELTHLFDENNPAVKTAIKQAIAGAKRNGKPVGLCGQGPSDKPDFAAFLVEQGIDSFSVTPDSVINAIQVVAKAENNVLNEGAVSELRKGIAKGLNMKRGQASEVVASA